MKITKSQLKEEVDGVLDEAKTFRHEADQAQKKYLQSLDGEQKKMLARYRKLERTDVETPEQGQAVDSEMEDLRNRGVKVILQTLVDIRAEKTKDRKPYKFDPRYSRTGFIDGAGPRGTGYEDPDISESWFTGAAGKVKDMAARVTGPRHALGDDKTKEAWKAIGGFLNTRSDEEIKQFHEKARISIPLEEFAANLRRAVEYGEEKFKIYSLSDALDAGYNSRQGRNRPKGRKG